MVTPSISTKVDAGNTTGPSILIWGATRAGASTLSPAHAVSTVSAIARAILIREQPQEFAHRSHSDLRGYEERSAEG